MDNTTLMILCAFATLAGFVDAIVGGGGLIQTPASLILLPQLPVATVIGSLKIPSFSGTFFAAKQYVKLVSINWKRLALMLCIAFMAAFAGSFLLTQVSNRFMKPIILFVLVFVAIYSFANKNFGLQKKQILSEKKQILYAILISLIIGFYDGFIGPGAGSFLVLAFISLLGFDFLQASAHAKLINLATNLGSISLFLLKGNILWQIAIPMAICNALGAVFGARMAIAKGNRFIRLFFLLVVAATLIRFSYDVFWKH
ncbi:MAG: TSUP family transporter [Chitinophagaceae bacterium]|nr:TSUP family transporter [Chitinophagaceae bacterium]